MEELVMTFYDDSVDSKSIVAYCQAVKEKMMMVKLCEGYKSSVAYHLRSTQCFFQSFYWMKRKSISRNVSLAWPWDYLPLKD
jgi:hypothetical protein